MPSAAFCYLLQISANLLILRAGRLGWMTPRAGVNENDTGNETRLSGPPIPSGGPFLSSIAFYLGLRALDFLNFVFRLLSS